MATPLNQRENDIFLSHSSRDKNSFVDGLYRWLTKEANLKVWYDRGLVSGEIGPRLDEAIDSCRSAIIVFSPNSVQSPWVAKESSRLEMETTNGSDFRIATVRLGVVDPPGLFKSFKHIDVSDGKLSADSASLLMETLFGGRERVGKPVYLSRGWRESERGTAARISQALQKFSLKLVCDWPDQAKYDIARVRSLIDGTGGLVAIIPHRGNGATSKYIIDEIAQARDAGLPVLAFAHREVALDAQWSLSDVVVFDEALDQHSVDQIAEGFANQIEDFVRSCKRAPRGEHVFLGHSLEESMEDSFFMARRLLSRITGLPVEVGGLVTTKEEAPNKIIQLIREAELCVIDITNLKYKDLPDKINFALNSCIEAGIALGCNKHLYLTCRKPRRSPPFMFRTTQVFYYANDLELVGSLRQIAATHRRMVL